MRDPSCTKCELHRFANTVCIAGDGPSDAKIFLVGEGPGAEEDKAGRPFVGAAGGVLQRALGEAGLLRSEVFISNTVACRPPQNRTPTATEQDACLPYLLEEIERIKPAIIVALGGSALKALTGKDKITRDRGHIHAPRKGLYIDSQITATFHPAATLRPGGQNYYSHIVEDLRMAKSLTEAKAETTEIVRIYPPGSTDQEIIDSLKLLVEAKVIASDLEWTAGPDSMIWPWSKRGEAYSISFTGRTPQGVVTVAIAMPLSPRVKAILGGLLKNRPIVFHNAMADTLWTYANGFDVQLASDTMLLAYLLDETQRLNLEAVATKYGKVQGGWKGHLFYARPKTAEQWQEILTYNASDTAATLAAFEGLRDAIKTQPPDRQAQILKLHKHMLLPAVSVLQRAAHIGIPIDVPLLKQELEQAKARRFAAAEELAEHVSLTPVAAMSLATSPKKTQEYLSSLGVDLESTKRDVLTKLAEYPAVAAILKVRKEQKRISTYFEPWLTMIARQGDGRLHSVYRITGTRTGRLSAESEEGGTIHTAPRDDDEVKFRRLIRAPDGRKIVSADYSQAELRVIAWQADEPNMKRFYTENIDLHWATAAFVRALGSDPRISIETFWEQRDFWIAKCTKLDRQKAKGGNFGLCFGMGEDHLGDYTRTNYQVVMTPEEVHLMHTGYFRLYAALPGWQKRSVDSAIRLGYSETPFGRRRAIDPSDANTAINSPIQSTASDLTMLAMIEVDKRLREEKLDAQVIGFVHDSILIDANDRDAERAKELLTYSMENVDTSVFGFRLPIAFPAEGEISQTWSKDT